MPAWKRFPLCASVDPVVSAFRWSRLNRFSNQLTLRKSGRPRRMNRPPATPETNPPKPVPLAESAQDHFISIFQKFPLLTRRQSDGIRASRCQFQQASARAHLCTGGIWSGNSSTRQQIARTQIAPIAGVVGKHLRHRPIKIAKIAAAQRRRGDVPLSHLCRLQCNFES